ncbi:MAG TPA: hypothetical protein VH209_09390, partial [Steroidobacteraceae bacterium]|nr:hypothetical protein [Steroidobacteraceae bacterium]
PDLVEEGPEEAPAELITGKNSQPLVVRDKEVHLALDTLKTKVSLARSQATPLAVRALVP